MAHILAKKNITGICGKNCVYDLDAFKSLYPYIDLKNTDFFTEVNPSIGIGDTVEFKNISSYFRRQGVRPGKIYLVTSAKMNSAGNIMYNLMGSSYSDSIIDVDQKHIEKTESLWMASLSTETDRNPSVHKISKATYNKKFKGTWKSYMVFESEVEAKEFAVKISQFLSRQL